MSGTRHFVAVQLGVCHVLLSAILVQTRMPDSEHKPFIRLQRVSANMFSFRFHFSNKFPPQTTFVVLFLSMLLL